MSGGGQTQRDSDFDGNMGLAGPLRRRQSVGT